MAKLSIDKVDLRGKRVVMRVDFNVPQDEQTGAITSTQRIVAALPTIQYAIDHGASVVLLSHLGRPDGERKAQFSLKLVAEKLGELIHQPVRFLPDCIGPEVERAAAELKPGGIILLENVRFHIEEEVKVTRKRPDGTEEKLKADPAKVESFRARSISGAGRAWWTARA